MTAEAPSGRASSVVGASREPVAPGRHAVAAATPTTTATAAATVA